MSSLKDREGQWAARRPGQPQASQLLTHDRAQLYHLEHKSHFYVPFLLFATRQDSDNMFLKVLLFFPSHRDKTPASLLKCALSAANQVPLFTSCSVYTDHLLLPLSRRQLVSPCFPARCYRLVEALCPFLTHMSLALRHGRLFKATVRSGLWIVSICTLHSLCFTTL